MISFLSKYFTEGDDWLQAVTFLDKGAEKIGPEKFAAIREYVNLEEFLEFAAEYKDEHVDDEDNDDD